MTGGIAYVHDPDGAFPTRVNPEMVDLEPLDDDDLELARATASRSTATRPAAPSPPASSPTGARRADEFVKVMPTDYKRVLEAAAAAREAGDDETEAIMAASRG